MATTEDERPQGPVQGRVRVWHEQKGWGVLDSELTPGGCWAHFSHLLVAGHRSLTAGEAVSFTFEEVDQDGFVFRVLEVWPAGQAPVRREDEPDDSSAFHSTLIIHVDADEDDGGGDEAGDARRV